MTIRFSEEAEDALHDIWVWTAERFGIERADAYGDFLRDEIRWLVGHSPLGRPISGTTMRYVTVKRRTGGNGHVAVYESKIDYIDVIRIFHTAQDWRSKLEDI